MAGFEGPSGTDSCEKCEPGKYKVAPFRSCRYKDFTCPTLRSSQPCSLADLADLAGLNEGGQAMPTALWPFEELLCMHRAHSPPPPSTLSHFCSMLRTTLVGSRVSRAQLERTAIGAATICYHFANRVRR